MLDIGNNAVRGEGEGGDTVGPAAGQLQQQHWQQQAQQPHRPAAAQHQAPQHHLAPAQDVRLGGGGARQGGSRQGGELYSLKRRSIRRFVITEKAPTRAFS